MSEPRRHSAQADQDLLFGVLAVCMDMVSRDQFLDALSAWAAGQEKSLGQIFAEAGVLSSEEWKLLDSSVQKHLEKHDGSVRRSLAALVSKGSIDETKANSREAEPCATQDHAPRDHGDQPTVTDSIQTLDQAESPGKSSWSRFRILRPHARGGLGQVYVALDDELHREVALKEIQNQHADQPDSRSRFLLEAEITGGLEHPGIVPVYSLGRYDDGRPYYAMRFIKGDSLAEAIERFHSPEQPRRSSSQYLLELRSLLRRFVDVCNAVAYAHSRGVLHRDLKPGNIMLGRFGETLVVDWGLAKATGTDAPSADQTHQPLVPHSGSGSTATQVGTAIGTPAFMSPEQAEGRLNDLGPRSDVYSLGATLYQLLTGRPPFQGNVGVVLRAVQEGNFALPHTLIPNISRPLEAICLKAMARRPGDRYPAPLDLARDIEHWLADEPVTAYREPIAARASRWMRKHRTATTTTITLLLAAAVFSTTGVIWIGRKNLEIQTERETALLERDRAETNFKMARDAVDKTLTAVSDNEQLKDTNFHDMRVMLLQAAVQFYEKFVQQKSDDPVLEDERGRAYFRLAGLRSEMGIPDAARAELETMQSIFTKLARDYPDDSSYREQLARSLYGLSLSYSDQKTAARGEELCREALSIQQTLTQSYPALWRYREQEALSRLLLGQLLEKQGKTAEAEAAYQKALSMQEELARQKPEESYPLQDIAMTKLSLGGLQLAESKHADAEQTLRSALALEQTLAKQNPRALSHRLTMTMCQNSLGRTLLAQKKLQEAQEAFHAAAEIETELADEYPQVSVYRKELANSQVNLGVLAHARGDSSAALKAYEVALGIRKSLALASPADPALRQELASTHNALGDLQREAGNGPAAVASHSAALTLRKALVRENPEVPAYRRELAVNQRILAVQYHLEGLLGPAEEAYRSALESQWGLIAARPDSKVDRRQLATSLFLLGNLLNEESKHKEAESVFRQALAIQAGLAAASPDTAEYRNDLARSHSSLGVLLSDLGRYPEAAAELRRALELGMASAGEALKQSEHEQALAARLPAVLQGTAKPKNTAELLELASLCQKPSQNRPLAALDFFKKAFAQDGKLLDDMQQQNRYNAACAAIRAVSDSARPDEVEKARLREQALTWLKLDLAYWSKQIASNKPPEQTLARTTLQRWQFDADLAFVRDQAIAKLPANEQAAWRQMWQDLKALTRQNAH